MGVLAVAEAKRILRPGIGGRGDGGHHEFLGDPLPGRFVGQLAVERETRGPGAAADHVLHVPRTLAKALPAPAVVDRDPEAPPGADVVEAHLVDPLVPIDRVLHVRRGTLHAAIVRGIEIASIELSDPVHDFLVRHRWQFGRDGVLQIILRRQDHIRYCHRLLDPFLRRPPHSRDDGADDTSGRVQHIALDIRGHELYGLCAFDLAELLQGI